MIYRIQNINIWSVVRIAFMLLLFIGIILGLFYLMVMGMIANFMAHMGNSEFAVDFFQVSGIMGIIGITIMAFFNAVVWSALIALFLFIYNLMGGIEVSIQTVSEPVPAAQSSTSPTTFLPPPIEEELGI